MTKLEIANKIIETVTEIVEVMNANQDNEAVQEKYLTAYQTMKQFAESIGLLLECTRAEYFDGKIDFIAVYCGNEIYPIASAFIDTITYPE